MTQPKIEIDPNLMVTIDNRLFCTYRSLLDLAERHGGLKRFEVEILQYPREENGHVSVAKTTVELMHSGKVAEGIGEASEKNLDPKLVDFKTTMSVTRSKCRSLKNLFGISQTALEELKDIDDVIGDDKAKTTDQAATTTEPKAEKKEKTTQTTQKKRAASTTKVITISQLKCIRSMAQRKKWTDEELNQHCKEKFNSDLDKINRADASSLISLLKAA